MASKRSTPNMPRLDRVKVPKDQQAALLNNFFLLKKGIVVHQYNSSNCSRRIWSYICCQNNKTEVNLLCVSVPGTLVYF